MYFHRYTHAHLHIDSVYTCIHTGDIHKYMNKIYTNVYVSAYISCMCTHRCEFVYARMEIIMYVFKIRFEVLPGVGMRGNTYD